MADLARRVITAFAGWQTSERTWYDPYARAFQVATAITLGATGLMGILGTADIAQLHGLKAINWIGAAEVKTLYGTVPLALAACIALTDCASGLVIGAGYLLGGVSGRLASHRNAISDESVNVQADNRSFHLKLALADVAIGIGCLIARMREGKAKAKAEVAQYNLVRRQSPDPQRLADFVPYCAENLQDPYPWYSALREEAPVHKPDGLDYYLVSRAEDVQTVCRDTATFSSNLVAILLQGPGGRQSTLTTTGIDAFTIGITDVLAIQDPPTHSVHRKYALNGLSPKLFASLEEEIRLKAREILESGFRGKKAVDWMDVMAFRLPMFVALGLCGLPNDPETTRRVKAQGDHGVALMSSTNTPEEFAEHAMGAMTLFRWIQQEFADILSNPERERTDLIASLIKGIKDGDLTKSEAESMILQILIAGNDSSASTMGAAMRILCERPDIQRALRDNPTLIPAFVEEVLRFESPFPGHFRSVKKDTVLNGTKLRKGDRIMLMWASANRDERFWDNPGTFRLDRGDKGKAHFAFGNGPHACIGSALARREVRVVIEEALKMFPSIAKAENAPKSYYLPSSFVRSLARYHVDFA